MCNWSELKLILSTFAEKSKEIFKDELQEIILFGSYARGDYSSDSDIDIMILVSASKEKIRECREQIIEIATELGWRHNMFISPIVQNYDEFERYKTASGFFKNIVNEGVKISA